jgi:hypothetical protein
LANYQLSRHFAYFFSRLNPSSSFEQTASSQYGTIKALIEARDGLACELSPVCFLQGSYRQQTALYTINDVDIVTLCRLWQPGSGGGGRTYDRDQIFAIIAAPLLNDWRYKDKVRYGPDSMCVKVDLGIKIEILPVVFKQGTTDPQEEPFRLYRPENQRWEDGYARYHQGWLSDKNSAGRAAGNFIPSIKVFKHLRAHHSVDAVSFHLECVLYSLADPLFSGRPADYSETLLAHLAATPAEDWYQRGCLTPCQERNIFTPHEWSFDSWAEFHKQVQAWARRAQLANQARDQETAIAHWQMLLGSSFFPRVVS